MNIECVKQKLVTCGMEVSKAIFLEEGYELTIRLTPDGDKLDDAIALEVSLRESFKKLDQVDFEGLVVVDSVIAKDAYRLLLVPKSQEEMTDFIWKYVEKYGRREKKLVSILSDAFSVLESTIERIPSHLEEDKKEAKENYEKFSSMIF